MLGIALDKSLALGVDADVRTTLIGAAEVSRQQVAIGQFGNGTGVAGRKLRLLIQEFIGFHLHITAFLLVGRNGGERQRLIEDVVTRAESENLVGHLDFSHRVARDGNFPMQAVERLLP